jgi:Ca2+-binding RTX toxin-like protein
MNVKLSANKTIVNPGDVVDVVAVVGNKGSAGTSKAIVKITLPAGLVLAGPPASERGGGCSGSTTIVCDLDFFPGDFTTPVRFAVRTSANGAQEITAEVTPQGDDADRSDNKATLVLQVGATAPTTTTTTPTTPVPKPTPGTSRTTGTARADTLVGTPKADTLRGLGGNDTLRGGGGNDVLDGGRGRDRLDGGPGNDLIRARDGERDVITCGQGRDRVLADRRDSVARDCEHVSRG